MPEFTQAQMQKDAKTEEQQNIPVFKIKSMFFLALIF